MQDSTPTAKATPPTAPPTDATVATVTTAVVDAAPVGPTKATPRMMLDIAAGKPPLAQLVDEKAGVVFIDDFGVSPQEEAEGKRPSQKTGLICGKALTGFIRKWQARMAKDVRLAKEAGGLSCEPRPSGPTCSFGRLMEWDPAVHFVFREVPDRGLVLQAITLDDEADVEPDAVEKTHAKQDALIAKLSKPGCPATP